MKYVIYGALIGFWIVIFLMILSWPTGPYCPGMDPSWLGFCK